MQPRDRGGRPHQRRGLLVGLHRQLDARLLGAGRRRRSRPGRGRSGRPRSGCRRRVEPGRRSPCVSTLRSRSRASSSSPRASTHQHLAQRRCRARARPSAATASETSAGSCRDVGERRPARHGTSARSEIRRVARRDGLLELVDPLQQGAELELAEQLLHRRPVGRLVDQRGQVDVDRDGAVDGRQQLRLLGVLGGGAQRLAPLLAGAPASRMAYTPSRLPNWTSRSAAVFSPMPGTPGMLSDVSPLSPMKSGTARGRCRSAARIRSGV